MGSEVTRVRLIALFPTDIEMNYYRCERSEEKQMSLSAKETRNIVALYGGAFWLVVQLSRAKVLHIIYYSDWIGKVHSHQRDTRR